jgi:hypothetical protein
MKERLLKSILGGMIIPVVYYGLAVAIAFVVDISIGWENVAEGTDWWLFFPIAWPESIYTQLFTRDMFDFFSTPFLLILIGGNFLLYASLTYAFLTLRARRQRLP